MSGKRKEQEFHSRFQDPRPPSLSLSFSHVGASSDAFQTGIVAVITSRNQPALSCYRICNAR